MDLTNHILEFNRITKKIDTGQLKEIAQNIADTIKNNGSIYICGNGGSGSSANLFASLLLQMGIRLNLRVNAISLNSNMVTVSALAYEYGYQNIFNLQLRAANHNDLLIVISGSGSSPNILAAVKNAKEMGLNIIGLTGLTGGKLKTMVDKIVFAPSDNMQQIENIHYIYIHAIVNWLHQCL